jgi:hypothetical protein
MKKDDALNKMISSPDVLSPEDRTLLLAALQEIAVLKGDSN